MTNVYILPPRRGNRPMTLSTADAKAFEQMTDRLVMLQATAGTLNPNIVAALLAVVRQPAGEGSR